MIDEKKLRPIVVTLAKKLCFADGKYLWKPLRDRALDGSSEQCLDQYRRYLRMAKAAVKFLEGVK